MTDFLCMSCRKYKNEKSLAPVMLFRKLVCLTCLESYKKRPTRQKHYTTPRYDEKTIDHLARTQ